MNIQGTPVISPGKMRFKKGDILPGKVLEKVGTFQYRILFGGTKTIVSSRVNLQSGQPLLFRVEAFTPRLKLKLLSTPNLPNRPEAHWLPVLQTLGLKHTPLNIALIEHLLLFKIPIRKKDVQQYRRIIADVHQSMGVSPETAVLPIGIWYHLVPEVFSRFPTFLLQWMWGKRDSNSTEPPFDAEETNTDDILRALKELKGLFMVHDSLITWPEMFISFLQQKISSRKQISSFSEREMLKFHFVKKQIERLKFGQWAGIPLQLSGKQMFLWTRWWNMNAERKLIVQFTVPLQPERFVNFRITLDLDRLLIEYWNPDKAFLKQVENGNTKLMEKLAKITKFNTIIIHPNPHLGNFQGLWDYFREIKLNVTGVF